MKKYFVEGIDEPLEYGDTVNLDLAKDSDGKGITKHATLTFTPQNKDVLIDLGIVEEREVEEKEDDTEDDECPLDEFTKELNTFIEATGEIINSLSTDIEDLKKRVKTLERESVSLFSKKDFSIPMPPLEKFLY